MSYYRRVIRITAEDSPNVRLAKAQIAAGRIPTGEVLIPGVLPWADYCKRRDTWDEVKQCVSLDAQFWKGKEALMYPPQWLDYAEQLADTLPRNRRAKWVGVDPAEGGDSSTIAGIDDYGLVELNSWKTPNTDDVVKYVKAFVLRHGVAWDDVTFDRGGGGKQHADRLRAEYKMVRSVGFGESPSLELKRGLYPIEERKDVKEEKYVYFNRRAEMYGDLREELEWRRFALPRAYTELRRQLAPIPLLYDSEGRIRMLPKRRKDPNSREQTLTELLGRSPDDADALVLALHSKKRRSIQATAGAM